MRLLLEADHFRRKLGRGAELGQVDKLPALDLGAVAEVQVFGERVVLPAAGIVDGLLRHTPAVPLKCMNRPERLRAVCSMTKCPSRKIAWLRVSSEASRLRWSQRTCTMPTLSSVK
jgi:hypothetical protein